MQIVMRMNDKLLTSKLTGKLNENVLRSAFASKLAYAKTISKASTWRFTAQLHGSRDVNSLNQCVWMINSPKTTACAYAWKCGENSTLIAFKGSSSIEDIAAFLDMKQVDYHFCDYNMRIHSGIMRMFDSIEKQLSTNIIPPPLSRKPRNITFCGHSMGGALAMFAAAYYSNITHGNLNVYCHTFGAPKIGDITFHKWLNLHVDEQLHLVNDKDIIAYLPFDIMGYQNHFDHTFFIEDPEYRSLNICESHDLDTYIDFLHKSIETGKTPGDVK